MFTGAGSSLSGGATESNTGGDGAKTDAAPGVTTPTQPSSQSPDELLRQAEVLFAEADAALGQNPPDFATYQQKLAAARALVREAISLLGG